ncbi:GGDEF domain-containing protein [Marinobacter sp. CHS3-4]|uniref:sensor domain-containing diguanylate cyclase n=1 Tax=Marinobacter sp. CHS3-4 TaxID=3045174 RepID=UPI0024B4E590|nr:GGDEF domain-containing protein [Marinobacter sp. CHS3-4]MDI9246334.1 diguanylate cyclase [Marinobacter sp. CHS3-4]
MNTWTCSWTGRLALTVIICFCYPSLSQAKTDLETGWEYRWGDSPFTDEGIPEWTLEDEPEQWNAIGFPSNPPNRQGRDQVWYRVALPDGPWREPVLYIFSVDLIVQLWLDGDKIYQYGHFNENGKGKFEGWPWHAITLPEGFQGKEAYFRIYSDYTDIGLWGEVAIMESSALTLYILNNSLEALLIAGFSALIAVLSIIFALLQESKKTFASLALFAILSSILLIAESQARQLIFNAPLAWDYLAAGSYFLLPVAMALLLEQWFEDQRPWLINLMWKIHLGYFVVALVLAGVGVVNLSTTFPIFDVLLLASMTTITVLVVRRFRHLALQQQAILLAYGLFGALLVIDMAVAHGFLPWWRVPLSWGALVFSLVVVVISLYHYANTQQSLKLLNQSLEEKVNERTARAESLARREQARVRLLTFENEKTRILNDIIAALQDCISVHQTFQVLSRMLPDLCSPMKGSLYLRTEDGMAYRLLNQWGYAGEDHPSERLETPHGPPPNTDLSDHFLSETDFARGKQLSEDNLCLWVSVQSATRGTVPLGLIFLNVPESLVNDDSQFGAVKLFQSLIQGVQKIGITISGISLREELKKYSYEDALTGLKNRRYFDQLFEHETAVALRSDKPLALLMMDIDHFKRFNDTYGHEAGDAALRSVSSLLLKHFRESDVVCRYGGEEFVVIMTGTTLKATADKAAELVRATGQNPVAHGDQELPGVTLSVGVAGWPESAETPISLLGQADRALYRAKEMGRNRVEIY